MLVIEKKKKQQERSRKAFGQGTGAANPLNCSESDLAVCLWTRDAVKHENFVFGIAVPRVAGRGQRKRTETKKTKTKKRQKKAITKK